MATLKIGGKSLIPIALMAVLCLLLPADTFAQNLLKNGDFSQVNSEGPQSRFTWDPSRPERGGGSQSGAQYWTTWAAVDPTRQVTLATDLIPSSFPQDTGNMLAVETDRGGGIVQVFGPLHEGPEEVTACVWLLVKSGAGVCVGIGDGGNTHCSMNLTEKNKWERITVSNGISPANELIIYALGAGEFHVRYAAAYKGPSWDQDGCCSPAEFLESPEEAK